MRQHKTIPDIIIEVLVSPKVTLGLFALLVVFLLPATFSSLLTDILRIPVEIILALIALNLTVCTMSRLKSLRASTLTIHLGTLLILGGGLINNLGFIATVNIYEGDSINQVFRWDMGKNAELGFDIRIAGINFDYYPVAVKVGVLKDSRKTKLVITRTGDSFVFEKYRIQVVSLNPQARTLELAVKSVEGSPIGTLSTAGRRELPADFPLDFKLVAFQNPEIKRIWIDLEILEKGQLVVSGTSEVNHPLQWGGMQFFLTKVTTDAFNRKYAGIQISKAPGIPYVYCGFAVFCLGLLLLLGRWFKNTKSPGEKQPTVTSAPG